LAKAYWAASKAVVTSCEVGRNTASIIIFGNEEQTLFDDKNNIQMVRALLQRMQARRARAHDGREPCQSARLYGIVPYLDHVMRLYSETGKQWRLWSGTVPRLRSNGTRVAQAFTSVH